MMGRHRKVQDYWLYIEIRP